MTSLHFLLTLAAGSTVKKEEVLIIIPPTGAPKDPGPEPRPNQKGAYACMLESMASGQVTEIKPKIIFRWETPQKETWEGFTYWAIALHYRPETVFSKAEVTARALIRQNRVHRWLYVGSDEVVP